MWTTLPPPVHSASGRVEICTTTSGLDPALTDGGCGRVPLKLRAIRANGDFDDYWRFHVDHERQRVHESRYHRGIIPLAA